MPRRLAAILSLVVFALCLLMGGLQAGNPFGTIVLRALLAMGGTFVIGLVIGVMAEIMLNESVAAPTSAPEAGKLKNSEANSSPPDR
jgi:NhaP-type Na+/H+ or K+/H+ antiporter